MEYIEALEHLEGMRGSQLLRERVSLGIDGPASGAAMPRGHQQLPQAEEEREFVLHPRGALRQGRQQRQPFPQGGERFGIGMAPLAISPVCCQ